MERYLFKAKSYSLIKVIYFFIVSISLRSSSFLINRNMYQFLEFNFDIKHCLLISFHVIFKFLIVFIDGFRLLGLLFKKLGFFFDFGYLGLDSWWEDMYYEMMGLRVYWFILRSWVRLMKPLSSDIGFDLLSKCKVSFRKKLT